MSAARPALPAASAFRILAADSVRDATRRRIVAFMVVLSLLSLLFVDSCTSCAGGNFTVNGEPVDASGILGLTGIVLFGMLVLWTVALAGVLASDHLTQALDDGTALLVLARPVGRASFALARLAGSLVVSGTTGAVLLLATAGFLLARYELALGPALLGLAVAAAGGLAVASLAMTASLWLPRLLCFLLVFVFVGSVAGANLAAVGGMELGGFWGAVDRFGPPLGTGLALLAAEWAARPLEASALEVALRLLLWAVFAPALLAVAFGRREL